MNASNENINTNPQTKKVVPKRRLGRGLDALLGGAGPTNEPHSESSSTGSQNVSSNGLLEISLDKIRRNESQPRKHFEKESLQELADSVRIHGVLQPVLVREYDDKFELIAGERRWLAAKQAGLSQIPCRVVDVVDQIACEYSFEENIKRKDLSPLEKAQAFRNYIELFKSNAEELGKQLSMSRSAILNTMRLLELPVPVKNALQEEKISAGHARALLGLKDEAQQLELADRIQKENLSVRKTESAVKEIQAGSATIAMPKPETPAKAELTNHLKSLQNQFREAVGVKVDFKLKSKDSGQVILHFANNDDFERISQVLRKPQSKAA